MKSCEKCGTSMEEETRFCARCGAAQNMEQDEAETARGAQGGDDPHKASVVPSKEQTEKAAAQLQFLPYTSAALIIISVFMPWVSFGQMFDITLMDVSKPLMLAVIAITCAATYAIVSRRRYAVGLAMAQSFVLFGVAAFLKYESMLSELKRGLFGAIAGAAISLDLGAAMFAVGALWLTVESVLLAAAAEGAPFLINNHLIARWKELIATRLKLVSLEVPAWIYSIVLAVLLFLLLSQSQLSQMMR